MPWPCFVKYSKSSYYVRCSPDLEARLLLLEEKVGELVGKLNTSQEGRGGRRLGELEEVELGQVHFSAQSSSRMCCSGCVLSYDSVQVVASN